jgi:hypothetical protein
MTDVLAMGIVSCGLAIGILLLLAFCGIVGAKIVRSLEPLHERFVIKLSEMTGKGIGDIDRSLLFFYLVFFVIFLATFAEVINLQ